MLNEVTVKDAYPLPVIDHMFAKLSQSSFYTKIVCFSGFYQIKLDQENLKYIKSYAKLAQPFYELMLTNHLDSSYRNKNGTIKSKRVQIELNEESLGAFEN